MNRQRSAVIVPARLLPLLVLLAGCYQNPDPYDAERQQSTAGSNTTPATTREPYPGQQQAAPAGGQQQNLAPVVSVPAGSDSAAATPAASNEATPAAGQPATAAAKPATRTTRRTLNRAGMESPSTPSVSVPTVGGLPTLGR